ncbi:3' terminal RNA ribose 2'-O-methyltransferase Hen1 [Pseudomarimonas arenosa]|uniref:Small RNA 2'-O-methyltransferase n=1 Tax=Pseudomarimonas arenosa TaxID=2774145 RepID=A0AAW3ZE52_9GAMM|nr:3' terminal RNA ribose 2'-O-methyltransferase Hen1 [Pseudomarimonas arenosa]MBD8524273.1 3' terminal RNA ribose 2'-O-methyltransferase Hen1 [Pseudomarimonas arenosa]
MLMKLSTTHRPATDIGYLLSKSPERPQSKSLSFGTAHVFYPEASEECCSVVLLVDVDPVALVRGRGDADGPLAQYVNDRPYVASSFLAVAIAQVFSSAMGGRSKARAELAEQAIPLQVELPVIRCRGGEAQIRRCFEPLGFGVEIDRLPLDPQFPDWGDSPYYSLRLSCTARLADLLTQLYVLLPAMDGDKHYYIGADEVQKVVDKGGSWLSAHPERDWILAGYLKRKHSLVAEALGKLLNSDEHTVEQEAESKDGEEISLERKISLNERRMQSVESLLVRLGVRSVLDVGCGEGRLLSRLLDNKQFDRMLGIEVSSITLERAAERLKLDRLPPLKRARIDLQQGSLTYRDARMEGFHAACAIEVIEHIDASRLPAFERTLFEFARPAVVVITTPNIEYNSKFESLPTGRLRHRDHRFEWTRAEFAEWAQAVAQRHGYSVEFHPIGELDPELGAPTQMGVFSR